MIKSMIKEDNNTWIEVKKNVTKKKEHYLKTNVEKFSNVYEGWETKQKHKYYQTMK